MTEPDFEPADTTEPLLQSKTFVSYAQNFEDVMLYRALREVERGYYIDVGACEPELDSVTCAFYRRGWRGINLEPAPDAFERLSTARPDDTNLNVAAGDQNGTTSFFLIGGGNGLSTAIPAHAEKLRQQGWPNTEIQVPVRTLASIFKAHVSGTIHFLKIDAEGSERAVLSGADLHQFRPWIILVEATAPNSRIPTHQDWEDLLLDAGYHFVWFDGLNRFYVSDEKIELQAAFQVQPNVFDGFVRYSDSKAYAQLTETRISLADAIRREQQTSKKAERLVEERDAWMQELFEANRYAAHMVQARQTLLDEVAQLNVRIAAMYASTSWKFSRPIRAVGKLWRRS